MAKANLFMAKANLFMAKANLSPLGFFAWAWGVDKKFLQGAGCLGYGDRWNRKGDFFECRRVHAHAESRITVADNDKRKRKRPLTKSTSRKIAAERYQDYEGNWRVRIRAQRVKFDEESKAIFLAEYAKHGRMETSAKAAGVSGLTVHRHMAQDDDFAEACLAAEYTYRDRLIEHHQNLVFEGTEKENYDRNGNLTNRETIYPIRLIELELKKHDQSYRDKREVDVKVTGGVLVAPATVDSIEDWERKFSKEKEKVIEVVEDESKGS